MDKTIQDLADEILKSLKGRTVLDVIIILRIVRERIEKETKV